MGEHCISATAGPIMLFPLHLLDEHDVAAPHAAARAVKWQLLQSSAEAVALRWKVCQRDLKATQ